MQQALKNFFSGNALRLFTILLGAYTTIAIFVNFSTDVLLHAAVTFGSVILVYFLWKKVSGKNTLPWNWAISAMIVFLLLHPFGDTASLIAAALLGPLLFVVKKIAFRGRPVVNPAVGALLLLAVIGFFFPFFGLVTVSWWGAAFAGSWSLLFLAPAFFVAVQWFRKWIIASAHIATFLVLTVLSQDVNVAIFAVTHSTLYFLAGIMLLEPKTSPTKPYEQLCFGMLSGILVALFFNYPPVLPSALTALFVANAIYFFWREHAFFSFPKSSSSHA